MLHVSIHAVPWGMGQTRKVGTQPQEPLRWLCMHVAWQSFSEVSVPTPSTNVSTMALQRWRISSLTGRLPPYSSFLW